MIEIRLNGCALVVAIGCRELSCSERFSPEGRPCVVFSLNHPQFCIPYANTDWTSFFTNSRLLQVLHTIFVHIFHETCTIGVCETGWEFIAQVFCCCKKFLGLRIRNSKVPTKTFQPYWDIQSFEMWPLTLDKNSTFVTFSLGSSF